MLPFIRGGRDSVVLVRPEMLAPMDIVLVQTGMSYVLHRIMSVEDEHIVLMGDGNLSGVEHCERKDVLAKAIKIVRADRIIDCLGWTHRTEARIWRMLLPLRKYLLAIYKRLS